MNAPAQASAAQPGLGIIAGGGELPRLLIEACQQAGRPYFVFALEGNVDDATFALAGEHCAPIRFGGIGKAMDLARKHQVGELVMAGPVKRPRLTTILPDMKGAKLLARIGAQQLMGGDNELLSSIIGFIEEEGFKVTGAEEILRDLITPEGMIGSIYPDKRAQSDIALGAKIARGIGALDIGQSAIVQNGVVLGVEAAEGTDGLLARCTALKLEEKGGVLVKVKKPQQERRVDLPTIGVATVERVAECGFAGIAVEAGGSLIINRREVARRADQLGIFVLGFSLTE